MVQIKWTHQALSDLNSIYEYIANDSRKYAKIQVIKLRSRTHILKSNPYVGKLVPELRRENLRELIEGNYRIIYKLIDTNKIDIITIHHTSRELFRRKL